MKKSAFFSAILVVSLSAATASAQSFASPQAVSGTNPRPQAVSGTNPRPQAVSGTNPRPQAVSSPLGTLGMWFSTVMSVFGM